ncbi:PIN2/TERF1-interacting telomerase inhibitor 1 [Puntigrus tetrazona]|uniref:PIN2/TERF1-interacting telomerase inhibitor 1 n=1 Tax=Puntigrus tetrazona TaxID=1606681 RepID=UPI001C8A895C|nr:PIN2/TERF1-interacting telomerase inhibitor 1 [Puntigrus tetrazona]
MSMLAEPRRKQKWSVDPRNSAWSNDESKFGQKMLERMGWSKGKGLGRSEQGATEHVKVKVKNNNLGLGTAVNNEDNWIAHQDDFNQLLAELNSCHGQNTTDHLTQEQGFSLEEKSKTSKKRVHYMKFTKGKDLSSRSETDLACIFGKRSKRQTRDQDEGSSGTDSQEDGEDTVTEPSPEPQSITVNSTLTMQEYFSQRMAQIKKTQAARNLTVSSSEVSSNTPPPLPTSASMEESPNTSDMEQSKKKKKKKKNRETDRDEVEEDPLITVRGEIGEEPNHSQKKKKKNKSKREERAEDGTEVCSTPTVTEGATEEDAPTTGKRKKDNKKALDIHSDEPETIENENMGSTVSDKKKKKKRREEEEVTDESVSKKNKKKKK